MFKTHIISIPPHHRFLSKIIGFAKKTISILLALRKKQVLDRLRLEPRLHEDRAVVHGPREADVEEVAVHPVLGGGLPARVGDMEPGNPEEDDGEVEALGGVEGAEAELAALVEVEAVVVDLRARITRGLEPLGQGVEVVVRRGEDGDVVGIVAEGADIEAHVADHEVEELLRVAALEELGLGALAEGLGLALGVDGRALGGAQGAVALGVVVELDGVAEVGVEHSGVPDDVDARALEGREGLVDRLVAVAREDEAPAGRGLDGGEHRGGEVLGLVDEDVVDVLERGARPRREDEVAGREVLGVAALSAPVRLEGLHGEPHHLALARLEGLPHAAPREGLRDVLLLGEEVGPDEVVRLRGEFPRGHEAGAEGRGVLVLEPELDHGARREAVEALGEEGEGRLDAVARVEVEKPGEVAVVLREGPRVGEEGN